MTFVSSIRGTFGPQSENSGVSGPETFKEILRQNVSNSLYSFSSATFTGVTGREGPNITQARNNLGNPAWSNTYLNMSTQGIQEWTVPQTSIYRITVAGAQGGTGSTFSQLRGRGAVLRADISLELGTVLNLVVGQQGTDAVPSDSRGGGGGGGTFVYTGSIGGNGLILAAGGGGGEDDGAAGGSDARSDLNPTLEGSTVATIQTNNGLAGIGVYGQGAGWLQDAPLYTSTWGVQIGGSRFLGGYGNSASSSTPGSGGFGGGSGDLDDGGAGGGFTGGSTSSAAGGGAGGSYYAGLSGTGYTSIWTVSNYTWLGLNAGSGYITIQKL